MAGDPVNHPGRKGHYASDSEGGAWIDEGPEENGAPANADGSAAGSDVFAGTTFGGDKNVGGTDVAGFLKDSDPRDFMYGRDPNYAVSTAANERSAAAAAQSSLNYQGAAAAEKGAEMGAHVESVGAQAGSTLTGLASNAYWGGMNAANRAGAQADYSPANSTYQVANNDATQLTSMKQGPSAAQAQLQSGLNQAQASNLAMARSGHGFGTSASALTQAAGQNASAGQQAVNSSAQLSAQEQAQWNAQRASNLAAGAGISTNVGGALQQQGLSQAQLKQQTTAQNDQAQAALVSQGLGAMNNAGQLSLSGATSGAGITQAGETLGMQGTQSGFGAYGQGEQMAGINMSAQQQADLTREQGLIQNRGISAGIAAGNQAAINSGWGTALSTAGTIGAAAIASDAKAKIGINPLDGGPTPPLKPATQQPAMSVAPPPPPPQGLNNKQKDAATGAAAGQTAGSVAGGAIGSAILPGIGTAIGGVLGSLAGKGLGGLIASDIDTKGAVSPIDGGMTAAPMGYGQVNPSGSTQAGLGNSFQAGRADAAKAAGDALKAQDLKSQAGDAARASLLTSAAGNLRGLFGGGGSDPLGSLHQFEAMGKPTQSFGSPQPSWQNMNVTSDVHSKRKIEELHSENQALRTALTYPPDAPPPSMSMLNEAAADQERATPGSQIAYPPDQDPPSMATLNQAAADQAGGSVQPYRSAYQVSDEREKEQSAALDMVDKAPGYSYEYKDPARHGYGQHYGPMAQDLLKTPAGASTVAKTPDGTLAVNTPRLTLVNTAALHSMHQDNQSQFEKLKADIDALKSKGSSKADRKISKDLDRADQQYMSSLSGNPVMSARDAALAAQLDAADERYTGALSGRSGDAALSRELDDADARYSAPLAYGRTAMPEVAEPDYEALTGAPVPVADNGANGASGGQEPYMPEPERGGHHFWEVPDHSNGGRYVPVWDLPSAPAPGAQRMRARGAHMFGRG